MASLGVLPMVPLVILPMVPLVANGTIVIAIGTNGITNGTIGRTWKRHWLLMCSNDIMFGKGRLVTTFSERVVEFVDCTSSLKHVSLQFYLSFPFWFRGKAFGSD